MLLQKEALMTCKFPLLETCALRSQVLLKGKTGFTSGEDLLAASCRIEHQGKLRRPQAPSLTLYG